MTDDPSVLVAGEILVDFVPEQPGPPGQAGGYIPKVGGSGANVALALDRVGEPPLFWTRLATDDFGTFLRSRHADSSIPDDFLVVDQEARTTLAVVSHDEHEDRSFSFYREVHSVMEPMTVRFQGKESTMGTMSMPSTRRVPVTRSSPGSSRR